MACFLAPPAPTTPSPSTVDMRITHSPGTKNLFRLRTKEAISRGTTLIPPAVRQRSGAITGAPGMRLLGRAKLYGSAHPLMSDLQQGRQWGLPACGPPSLSGAGPLTLLNHRGRFVILGTVYHKSVSVVKTKIVNRRITQRAVVNRAAHGYNNRHFVMSTGVRMDNDEMAWDGASIPDDSPADASAPTPEGGESQTQTDEELFLAALNGESAVGEEEFSFAPIRRGQIIKGTIAGKSDSEILVDIGVKSEGIITGRELEQLDPDVIKSLSTGDEVQVYVLSPEGPGGQVQLSLRRALEEKDWQEAQEIMKQATAYHSKVTGFNKGGLIVRFGKLRGFVPASQISRERQLRSNGETPDQRWGGMIGEDILVKVIEVDQGRNRLILSERAAAKESSARRRAELMETLEVGQVHTGRVSSLADFGAFVDIGGADGLVHLSELAWEHVKHPSEVLKIGDEVKVEIINLDRQNQRIGLSRKRCLDDPWISLAAEFKTGQLVQGTITKMTKFGAFARLVERPEVEGLIHISELSDRRINHPREVVQEGQVVTLRVIRVDVEQRRLGLSLKQVGSADYMDSDWREMMEDDSPAEETQPEAQETQPETLSSDPPSEGSEV